MKIYKMCLVIYLERVGWREIILIILAITTLPESLFDTIIINLIIL